MSMWEPVDAGVHLIIARAIDLAQKDGSAQIDVEHLVRAVHQGRLTEFPATRSPLLLLTFHDEAQLVLDRATYFAIQREGTPHVTAVDLGASLDVRDSP
jgi:hypothetical protein